MYKSELLYWTSIKCRSCAGTQPIHLIMGTTKWVSLHRCFFLGIRNNLRQRLWHYYWLSSRACITHNFNNHTIINSTERHLLLWLLRIITDILYKLPGEHFQDPRRTVFKDPLISTILRKWRAPSPPILLLLFLQPYNQHQGLLFPLLLVTYFDYSFFFFRKKYICINIHCLWVDIRIDI